MTIKIIDYCRIVPYWIKNRNGFDRCVRKPVDMNHFLSEMYHRFEIDYRKFFKMDTLSKAGFLAAEQLLADFDREQSKEAMGIILFNRSSSLESDEAYQQTISNKDNYFPSPAVFVYTLPNITTGEIAIRHKIHGETSFYITPRFQPALIEEIGKAAFAGTGLKYLLTGWIEASNNEIDVCMILCEADGKRKMALNAKNIEMLYTNI
jgi:hypothetical protein